MFVVSEEAAAIRAAYETGGEFSAAMESRPHFPGIIDNAGARGFARAIAGWQKMSGYNKRSRVEATGVTSK